MGLGPRVQRSGPPVGPPVVASGNGAEGIWRVWPDDMGNRAAGRTANVTERPTHPVAPDSAGADLLRWTRGGTPTPSPPATDPAGDTSGQHLQGCPERVAPTAPLPPRGGRRRESHQHDPGPIAAGPGPRAGPHVASTGVPLRQGGLPGSANREMRRDLEPGPPLQRAGQHGEERAPPHPAAPLGVNRPHPGDLEGVQRPPLVLFTSAAAAHSPDTHAGSPRAGVGAASRLRSTPMAAAKRAGWGGSRPGAGKSPTNLRAVIEEVPEQVTPHGVVEARKLTVMDAIVDTLEGMGFLHDAAARVGVAVETVREWRKLGVRVSTDLAQAKRTPASLTPHERNCAELARRMAAADAVSRMRLLGLAASVASGGTDTVETVTKAVQVGDHDPKVVEITTRTATTLPNPGMVQWLLSHRWPADFNRTRVEVSGPDGGAIPVDVTSARDKMAGALADLEQRQAESAHHATATEQAAIAHGANGHTPTE